MNFNEKLPVTVITVKRERLRAFLTTSRQLFLSINLQMKLNALGLKFHFRQVEETLTLCIGLIYILLH